MRVRARVRVRVGVRVRVRLRVRVRPGQRRSAQASCYSTRWASGSKPAWVRVRIGVRV